MKTRLAILGVGRWGVHFVRNFFNHPQGEIVAIADPNLANLAACKAKFKINEDKIVLASNWQQIRNLALDAVVIATPASTHYSLIKDALLLGYHVLAEKPLTLDPSECLGLTIIAQKQQRQLFIDHTYLFHPAIERGQIVVNSGQLGQLRYGYASRTNLGPIRQDVDAMWDLAIHDLAIFNHWLGELPTQVQARGKVWLQPNLADLVWVTLIYPSGFQADLHLCWFNPDKQRRLCVVGSQGTLIFDEMSPDAPLTLQKGYLQQQDALFIPQGQSNEIIEIEKAEPLKRVCECFLQAIQTGIACPLASGQTATQLVQILQCLSLSWQRNGEIITVPLLEN